MGQAVSEGLDRICASFGLGSLAQADPIEVGLIQSTWRLRTKQGVFIAQQLHPIFEPGVTEDGSAICEKLRGFGIPTPQYLQTTSGGFHWIEAGRLWRVMTCLPGQNYAQAPDLSYLTAAGSVVAQMHRALQDWDYPFQFGIPHFHDTFYFWERLQCLWEPLRDYPEADWLLETLPQMFLPTDLPRQIIHGDLKLTNFLFDDDGQVTGVLDWDTCMYHNLYVEMGDALRSWGAETDGFNLTKVAAALQGYGGCLDPELTVQGISLITLELATRFLIDVAEDCYWQWDPKRYISRQAHNLARCRHQISLYKNLAQQRDPALSILATIHPKPAFQNNTI